MGRLPTRDRLVHFVGGGLSSAFDRQNMPQLRSRAMEMTDESSYWGNQRLKERLQEAFSYFYPLEPCDERPPASVGDFFTIFKRYSRIVHGLYTDYSEESYFVSHANFFGADDPYKTLKTTLKPEIDREAWAALHSDTSRPFDKLKSRLIAVKAVSLLGDEVMKAFHV